MTRGSKRGSSWPENLSLPALTQSISPSKWPQDVRPYYCAGTEESQIFLLGGATVSHLRLRSFRSADVKWHPSHPREIARLRQRWAEAKWLSRPCDDHKLWYPPPVATRTLFRNHREPIVIRGKWAAAVSQPSGDWNFILPPVLRVEGQMKWSCRYACVAHTREDYDSGRHKSGYTFLEVCEWLKYFNSDSGR